MIYLAVEYSGREIIAPTLPSRDEYCGSWDCFEYVATDDYGGEESIDQTIDLPTGTIERLIGRKLTWSDEPVLVSNY